MSEKIWLLKRCDLFQRLPPEALTKLELRCRARKFPRGSPICLPTDEADGVLLLTSGRAKICSFSIDGKQAILALIEPGALFGELSKEVGERFSSMCVCHWVHDNRELLVMVFISVRAHARISSQFSTRKTKRVRVPGHPKCEVIFASSLR